MRRALLIAGAFVCACGGGGGETGIDLAIRYDAALGLDRLALSASAGGESIAERTLLPAEQRPLSESGRESVLLLLPGELAGDEVTVRVDGLVRGDPVGSGQVVVALVAGELVPATVTVRAGAEPPCEPWDWEPANVVPCEDAAPDGDLELDGDGTWTLDTATGIIATPDGDSLEPGTSLVPQANGRSIRVIAVDALVIGAGAVLEATGPHPVLIAVWGDATIDGTIDISAAAGVDAPGGGDPDLCAMGGGGDGTAAESDDGGAGGGGGGGAYGGDGGDGGDGQGDGKGAKGPRGRAVGSPGLVPLVGGCSGGAGGDANGDAGTGGSGGGGGGALEIAARDSIALSGTLRVAGGGGHGGDTASASGSGGGGGGSGGAIFLHSLAIELSTGARLCANGGSGGEGALGAEAGAGGSAGTCGEERASTLDQVDKGGDGGRGGAADMGVGESGKAGSEGGAGGGGGGSVGRIHLRAGGQLTDLGALITPAAE